MNLLTDSIVTTVTHGAVEKSSLSAIIAALLVGEDLTGFPRLAAEQRPYFYRFSVRTAGKALRALGMTPGQAEGLPVDELELRLITALLDVTNQDDWLLYQPDYSRSAFLQPPTLSGKDPGACGYRAEDCSILTQTLGGKGHERKVGVTRALDIEGLVFALIEYQSSVPFGGRGNYESQLMGSRSGAGSGTPFMGVVIGGSLARTFRHDVGVLLNSWNETARYLQGDRWALWTESWDGSDQIPSTSLDPAFIPFARLVRLGEPKNGVFDRVWFHTSEGSRVNDLSNGGRLGDPFTPLVPDPRAGHLKVRGTLKKGYDYIEIARLLFELDGAKCSPSVAAIAAGLANVDDVSVVFEGTAYEQGKTLGFHRRSVRLPRGARAFGRLFGAGSIVASVHHKMLELTQNAKKTLRSALSLLLTHEYLASDSARAKIDERLYTLDALIDAHYLDFLFEAALADDAENRTRLYSKWLFETIVNEIYPAAARALPRSEGRHFADRVISEAYLRAKLRERLEIELEAESVEEAVS